MAPGHSGCLAALTNERLVRWLNPGRAADAAVLKLGWRQPALLSVPLPMLQKRLLAEPQHRDSRACGASGWREQPVLCNDHWVNLFTGFLVF